MMCESVSDLNISKINCCQGGKSSTIRIFVQDIASFRILQKLLRGKAGQSDLNVVSQPMFSCSRLTCRCAGSISELPWSKLERSKGRWPFSISQRCTQARNEKHEHSQLHVTLLLKRVTRLANLGFCRNRCQLFCDFFCGAPGYWPK